jgi:hypothetical protein
MRRARRSPIEVLALTGPVAAPKVRLAGLNGIAKPSLNSQTANVSGLLSASRTAPLASSGPNNVVTRNASAMPSVPARPSASALAVIRNGLRTGSGSGQNSPIDATGRPVTASKMGIASRRGARKCAGRETG